MDFVEVNCLCTLMWSRLWLTECVTVARFGPMGWITILRYGHLQIYGMSPHLVDIVCNFITFKSFKKLYDNAVLRLCVHVCVCIVCVCVLCVPVCVVVCA